MKMIMQMMMMMRRQPQPSQMVTTELEQSFQIVTVEPKQVEDVVISASRPSPGACGFAVEDGAQRLVVEMVRHVVSVGRSGVVSGFPPRWAATVWWGTRLPPWIT